ncbi:hypothetical protein JK361_37625 [Streptomyces sp. 5-8]|uniref:Secreted protein n=1 Tax=Streptomyces musisoli TaxID=2802280 RepID=A0ABS1PDT3_9ACTN|nr:MULTISPECIES: hypothetical protein [Streptomyces]MBL1110212.1 hypothetical protein [Streptomyces musisoli]MBY8843321.1 hypothetical protein [Streptomyces sp. SP2-10]
METRETAAGERPARTAEEAVERLRAALRGVGVVLPSLRVDPLSVSGEDPYALVDLGRCNLGVASRLAAALSRAPEYAVDTRSGRIGEVMGQVGGRVQLRPVGGGREWDCPPGAVEPAPPDEVLRERVRRLNRESVSGVT